MRKNTITAGLFLSAILLFFVWSVAAPDTGFSESENRYLSGKPEFTLKKLLDGSFGTEYETYLSDQFPLRNNFVAVKTNTERLLFKTDVNEVYFGRDQYYIEKFDTEDLETEQLEKNISFLSAASEELSKKLGEDHVRILLVPSASQILKDKLPAFAAPADQKAITDQVMASLKNPSQVLPVEEKLLEHKDEELYYKTDHHWTSLGAYYAYELYMESMGLSAWPDSGFKKEIVTGEFLGTIESKMNTAMSPDRITLYLPKKEQAYTVYYDGLPKAYKSLYNDKALEGKDKYSVFLDGNHGLTKIVNETAGEGEGRGKRLLIIKDSYAHSFAPFVANQFEEVCLVDLRYFNMNLYDFIKQQNITDSLILYQIPGFSKDKNIFKMAVKPTLG